MTNKESNHKISLFEQHLSKDRNTLKHFQTLLNVGFLLLFFGFLPFTILLPLILTGIYLYRQTLGRLFEINEFLQLMKQTQNKQQTSQLHYEDGQKKQLTLKIKLDQMTRISQGFGIYLASYMLLVIGLFILS